MKFNADIAMMHAHIINLLQLAENCADFEEWLEQARDLANWELKAVEEEQE